VAKHGKIREIFQHGFRIPSIVAAFKKKGVKINHATTCYRKTPLSKVGVFLLGFFLFFSSLFILFFDSFLLPIVVCWYFLRFLTRENLSVLIFWVSSLSDLFRIFALRPEFIDAMGGMSICLDGAVELDTTARGRDHGESA
jgi:hypothetical protein